MFQVEGGSAEVLRGPVRLEIGGGATLHSCENCVYSECDRKQSILNWKYVMVYLEF